MPHPNVTKFMADNGDHVQNDTGDWWVFETGAMIEPHYQYGALVPAFKEVDARQGVTQMMVKRTLRNRLYYAQKKLGAAIRTFEELKKELEQRANSSFAAGSFPPSDSEVQKLYDAKTAVEKFQTMAEAVELELNPPSPAAQQQHIDPAVREKSKAVLETIKSIEV